MKFLVTLEGSNEGQTKALEFREQLIGFGMTLASQIFHFFVKIFFVGHRILLFFTPTPHKFWNQRPFLLSLKKANLVKPGTARLRQVLPGIARPYVVGPGTSSPGVALSFNTWPILAFLAQFAIPDLTLPKFAILGIPRDPIQ